MSSKLPVIKIETHTPPLDELRTVLTDGLKDNFGNVEVNVLECPDLRQPPFHLAAEGLNGRPRLVDVGGPPYLLPLVQRNKIFGFKQIAEHAELPNAFMIGAGAGPAHVIGVNSELANNVKYDSDEKCTNKACIAKIDTKIHVTMMFYRRPQTVIFWVFKQAGPNTVSYKKGWNLPQAGLNREALQIFNCDIDA